MVPGDPGNAGPNAPRPVGEGLKFALDPVTLQFLPMVEIVARVLVQIQNPATNTSVSLKGAVPWGLRTTSDLFSEFSKINNNLHLYRSKRWFLGTLERLVPVLQGLWGRD